MWFIIVSDRSTRGINRCYIETRLNSWVYVNASSWRGQEGCSSGVTLLFPAVGWRCNGLGWPSSITEDIDKSGDIVGETGPRADLVREVVDSRECTLEEDACGVEARRFYLIGSVDGLPTTGGVDSQRVSSPIDFEPAGFHSIFHLQFEFTNRRIDTNRIKLPCFMKIYIIAKESPLLSKLHKNIRQRVSNLSYSDCTKIIIQLNPSPLVSLLPAKILPSNRLPPKTIKSWTRSEGIQLLRIIPEGKGLACGGIGKERKGSGIGRLRGGGWPVGWAGQTVKFLLCRGRWIACRGTDGRVKFAWTLVCVSNFTHAHIQRYR